MKILHCSDIHLGRRVVGANSKFSETRFDDYFAAFDYIVSYAVESQIDVFVIAGDLFDKKELSPEVLSRTENILLKLDKAKIPCIVIEGNHDNISVGKESESWLNYLVNKNLIVRPTYSASDNIFIFTPVKIGNVNFYGLGYPGIFADELLEIFADSITPKDGESNYVIIHTAMNSSDFIHGTVKRNESVDKLIGKVDYIAAGHFHSYNHYPSDNPVFFVPGSPEMWDLNEYKQTKGFIIFDSETKTTEFVPIKNRITKVIELKTDASDLMTATTFLVENLNLQEIEQGSICYLLITLSNQIELNISALEENLYQKGALKVVTKINGLGGNVQDFAGFESTLRDVESDIISSWDKFGKIQIETHQLIDHMKKFHTEKMESDFNEVLDIFLEKMISGNVK